MRKIPNWRYALSHLWEQRLETTASDHNDYLEVSLVAGRLQLTAQEAIYSFGDRYRNFRDTFQRFDFSRLPRRAEVLVLGLGLGSVPELLGVSHGLAYHFTAVEIDEEIVRLASAYSLPRLPFPVEVVTADAEQYLRISGRQFDLICMDVFQDAKIPTPFTQPPFLDLLATALRPGGAIIYNCLASTRNDRRRATDYYHNVFQTRFAAATYLDTGGNFMLLNDGKFLLSEDEANLS